MKRTGWLVRWVLGKEVFTSPTGEEYVRAPTAEAADLTITPKSRGLPLLHLRLGSADHLHKLAARKERRLERRTARLRR